MIVGLTVFLLTDGSVDSLVNILVNHGFAIAPRLADRTYYLKRNNNASCIASFNITNLNKDYGAEKFLSSLETWLKEKNIPFFGIVLQVDVRMLFSQGHFSDTKNVAMGPYRSAEVSLENT